MRASRRWMAVWCLIGLACAGCSHDGDKAKDKQPTGLQAATDVFWALHNDGYIVSKEKPNPSSHGCKPFEYLAKKEKSLFHISVFECADGEQAKTIVKHPKNRHVDDLLRNHDEGGMFQRGRLQIIVRRAQGDAKTTLDLMKKMESW